MYGKELILDLYDCDIAMNTPENLDRFYFGICDVIGMERAVDPVTGENLAFYWTEENPALEDHLIGTSGIQFIRTSNIVVHTLDKLGTVYINLFSCKDFDSQVATNYCKAYFGGKIQHAITLERG